MHIIKATIKKQIYYSADYDLNNHTLWIYGIGTKKFTKYEEIDIPDSNIFTFEKIWNIIKEYGFEVAKSYFEKNIVNNADRWNHNIIMIANHYKENCKYLDKFFRFFNIHLYDNNRNAKNVVLEFFDYKLFYFGMVFFDIFKFDNYLKSVYGYIEDGKTSMQNFILNKFGSEILEISKKIILENS